MNTYRQDVIPIYITLSYTNNSFGKGAVLQSLKFPINPDNLKKEINSNSETVNIEGLGEVSLPCGTSLAKMTISSFFWFDNPHTVALSSSLYVAWLEKWQKSKQPAHLVITRLNYSMQVTCESFKHWINAGEEDDVYLELELQEYRPYGAKKLHEKKDESLLETLQYVKDYVTPPILYELPRPTRSISSWRNLPNPYIVKQNQTLITITKLFTGSTYDWRALYDENKTTIGNKFGNSEEIPIGTKLFIPEKWTKGYSIISL